MELDIETIAHKVAADFKSRPVFMTYQESEKLRRRIKSNCAAGKILSPYLVRMSTAVVLGFGAIAVAEHAVPALAAGGATSVVELFRNAAVKIGLSAAVTIAVFKSMEHAKEYFEGKTRRLAFRYAKEQMRKGAWKQFQHDLRLRIYDNVLETRQACAARDARKAGAYVIPLMQSVNELSVSERAVFATLDKAHGELVQPNNRESWMRYNHEVRLRKRVLKALPVRRPMPDDFMRRMMFQIMRTATLP